MTTTCASCGFTYQPTSSPPRCTACGAVGGGFAPPPMGGVPGQGPYAPTPAPGGYGYGAPAPQADLDVGWLLWGAIAMVFCCQPFGIASLVLMDQAKSAHRVGDHARAQQKLASMKTCVYIGIGLALAIVLLYVVMIVVGVGAAILGSRP